MPTPTPVQFRSRRGDPADWMPADIDSYEVLADIAALEVWTTHLGACTACQGDQACTFGAPFKVRFQKQDRT
ncbi:hypothetical protein [Streptomyces odonnellii]|uniref:hypothetical protein n=1 Tax=Streptomyces odonnellii TaxID=1417980 RepID=UPI000625F173|nr:hypothetical protein [Streptomyces odonnellii]